MQTIEFKVNPLLSVVDQLSPKGRGYFEAFGKLIAGHDLWTTGLVELRQLESNDITEVTGTVKPLIDKGENEGKDNMGPIKELLKAGPMSASELAEKLKISPATVLRRMVGVSDIKKVGTGNSTKWVLKAKPRATSKKSEISDFQKLALEKIKADPWMSNNKLMKELGIGYHTVADLTKAMENAGMIRRVKKSGNPAHPKAGKQVYFYWEALTTKAGGGSK